MNRAFLLSIAALSFGCSNVSDAVGDLATVDVGAESLGAVEIERSVTLGVDKIPACLDFSATLPASTTTVALQNSPSGCSLTIGQPDLVLVDQQAIARARDQSGDFEADGIRGGSIQLEQLDLSTAEGGTLKLADYIDALSVKVDGELLLDRVAPSELDGDAKLTRKLPKPILDKLKSALTNDEAAMADVVITLWLRNQGLADLPDTINLRLVLQPELQVDIVDATL